jgi:hypothetical protein
MAINGRGLNPRRVYDKDGHEIPPATVASTRAMGVRAVTAFCDPCGHYAVVPLDCFPGALAIPDIALKVRCSAWGAKRIVVHLDMKDFQPKGPNVPRVRGS